MPTCAVETCDLRTKSRGYCSAHYQRLKRHGDPLGGRAFRSDLGQGAGVVDACSIDECDAPVLARGWCIRHYGRWNKHGDPLADLRPDPRFCAVSECDKKHAAYGYCANHADRYRRHGDPHGSSPKRSGPGSRRVDSDGYVQVYWPEHPNARAAGSLAEHTIVMTEVLGRALLPGENVHHRNGIRDDNRPENLELWTTCQQAGQRVRDLVEFANWITERYGTDPTAYP